MYASHSRPQVAGPGHAAAMARRATAPSPPMMLMETRTGATESPASWCDIKRGSTTGRIGMESATVLEEENRALREELARYQSEAIGNLHRRPMAAIAGGGFRGPSVGVQKQCMCDSLRSKLAKIRAELREARCESRAQQGLSQNTLHLCRDAEAQTTVESVADVVDIATQATRAAVLAAAGADPPRPPGRPRMVDAQMQAESAQMVEVSAQTNCSAPSRHAEVQATPLTACTSSEGVQAGYSVPAPWLPPREAETQTAPRPTATDASAQAVAHGSDASVQAGSCTAAADIDTQTEAVGIDAAAQAGSPAVFTAAVSSQTNAPPRCVEASAQCEEPRSKSKQLRMLNSCAVACQTSSNRTSASVQTPKPMRAAVGSQASPPPGVDRGTQAEDQEAHLREAKRDTKLHDLEERVLALTAENSLLREENDSATEKAEAFQRMAQSRAFGQMNVTILCPRAECTVSGERVEMDSWNPQKLREEFEREVLPRFTRVFVDEVTAGQSGTKTNRTRSEAVDRAMQEFAETFRERLSTMLSAPNAAAAVQAAAHKGGR